MALTDKRQGPEEPAAVGRMTDHEIPCQEAQILRCNRQRSSRNGGE